MFFFHSEIKYFSHQVCWTLILYRQSRHSFLQGDELITSVPHHPQATHTHYMPLVCTPRLRLQEWHSISSVHWAHQELLSNISSVHWAHQEWSNISSVHWAHQEWSNISSVHWAHQEWSNISSVHWAHQDSLTAAPHKKLVGSLQLTLHPSDHILHIFSRQD